MTTGIVLISRAPIPGQTKTRLQTHLTPEECADLHRSFLLDIGVMLKGFKRGCNREINLYLTYTPPGTSDMFGDLIPGDFTLFPQQGEDLGQRMFNALSRVSRQNQKQIIIGSDLPTLQPGIFDKAIKMLDRKDVVIGPSQDGGYYLLGSRTPREFLFNDMVWGSNNVLRMTIRAIKDHGLQYGTVPAWLDIDVFPELQELAGRLLEREDWEFYPEQTASTVRGIFRKHQLYRGDSSEQRFENDRKRVEKGH